MNLPKEYVNDPLFVGFDRILDRMHHLNTHQPKTTNYPPYNIIKEGEDKYFVELAVAGWKQEDIEITVEDGELTIEGTPPQKEEDLAYLHKGIGQRWFKRTFTLADTVIVNGAQLVDGMLRVELQNVIPDEKKPRKIEIETTPALEQKELLLEE